MAKGSRGEPWEIERERCIYETGKRFVCACLYDRAAHIVASVNALDGLDPAMLAPLISAIERYREVNSQAYDPSKSADDVTSIARRIVEKRDARQAIFDALDALKGE